MANWFPVWVVQCVPLSVTEHTDRFDALSSACGKVIGNTWEAGRRLAGTAGAAADGR